MRPKPIKSAKPELTQSDVIELLRAQAQETLQQEGEYTFSEIVVLLGLEGQKRYKRKAIVQRLIEAGRLKARKPAHVYYYRLA